MDDTPPPVDALEEAYGIGQWRSVRALPGGKNQHFLVDTGNQPYALRRSHRGKTVDALRYEHQLLAFLHRSLFPVPQVVPTRAGRTWAEVGGRLYCMTLFVQAQPYSGGPTQLRDAARALAMYHGLVRRYRAVTPIPPTTSLAESLRQRVGAVRDAIGDGTPPAGDGLAALAEVLPYALEQADEALGLIEGADMPRLVIHGGCRRGSVLYDRGRLRAVLDFDSARPELRALDLAIALHDFSKVYTRIGAADHKISLDPEVAASFLAAYSEEEPLTQREIWALPGLLVAKRLQRALGRVLGVVERGESTPADVRKVRLELDRVRWLRTNATELADAVSRSARVLSSAG